VGLLRSKAFAHVLGMNSTLTAMALVSVRARKACLKGMLDEINHVLDDADKLIPVDTAAAADSRWVREPEEKGANTWVSGGYGPAMAERNRRNPPWPSSHEYVPTIHETTKQQFRRGQRKFLEIPFLLHQDHMLSRVTTIAKGVF